jgi:hypothetical protein
MFSCKATSIEELDSFRGSYLSKLPYFQDYFLECLVQQSQAWIIFCAGEKAGYVTINDNTLTELMIEETFTSFLSEHFKDLLHQLNVSAVYCKSFDEELKQLCITKGFTGDIEGILYRQYDAAVTEEMGDLAMRTGINKDLDFLLEQDDEVFEPKDILGESINRGELFIFEKQEDIVAVGFFTRIHPLFPYYDIGVWTRPRFRQQGIATGVLNRLKKMCIENSLIPICGCAADNVASQKALHKAGFLASHTLLKFQVTSQEMQVEMG